MSLSDGASATVIDTMTLRWRAVVGSSPGRVLLASADNDGELRIWDTITGAALTSLRVAGGLSHLQLTSTMIAAAGERSLYLLALCHGAHPDKRHDRYDMARGLQPD